MPILSYFHKINILIKSIKIELIVKKSRIIKYVKKCIICHILTFYAHFLHIYLHILRFFIYKYTIYQGLLSCKTITKK